MITLIDYGAGNLASLEGALNRLGYRHQRGETPDTAYHQRGPLILPGVGHFEAAVKALRKTGWWRELPHLVASGQPLLGICLGLHLLAEGSEEAPKEDGLSLIPGIARRLGPNVKVPHMGWAQVSLTKSHPAVLDAHKQWFYFVHSYALDPAQETLLTAHHGRPFAASANRGKVLGLQFHPEKSGALGLGLLATTLFWMGETALSLDIRTSLGEP